MISIRQIYIPLFTTILLFISLLMCTEVAVASHAYGGGPSGNPYDGGSGTNGMTATTNSQGGITVVNRETGGGGYLSSTGNWTQFDPNSGSGGNGGGFPTNSPPSVTVQAQITPNSTWYSNTVYITPDDELIIRWSSSGASSCTNNFGGPNTTSGTHDVTPNLNPGESNNYQVTCTRGSGSRSGTVTVSVPDILVDTFIANPRIVRSGETTNFEWQLELSDSLTLTPAGDLTPYSYECEIQGGTVDGVPHTFDASTNNGAGSVTSRVLTSKYVSTLQCNTSTPAETEVEVVPSVREI